MGISLFRGNCSIYKDSLKVIAPNPNPINFNILEIKQIGNNLVAKIKYPDCSNFEGIKICLYKNMSSQRFKHLSKIDPHFSKSESSPFARFKPNRDGWEVACHVAKYIQGE